MFASPRADNLAGREIVTDAMSVKINRELADGQLLATVTTKDGDSTVILRELESYRLGSQARNDMLSLRLPFASQYSRVWTGQIDGLPLHIALDSSRGRSLMVLKDLPQI